ncbi:hybrid sensor histidine kinase/response regulator [Lusitaniella coriacea LEGE 07157]|uniref:histidine kinase n=1 Tax=Lusitaniella coriacea LEGE 07157 TaxID=945747 RepID=A0A8J7DVT3_9CYAN|nr:hybrid sensor histidine kinase/response regulator [Lusitaniella coriacea]MBE9116011.1 hybrid sensor histidine kinase/response regulator [Lusitaniella coriacea LEGE 07157]
MSTTTPSIRDQAYQFFQQEALELLQIIEEGLLKLRAEFSIPNVHSLMRAAHSIKGGAASVELSGIQKIAHYLEDVFRALYHREEPLDGDLEEALLQAYDCLRSPLVEQLQTGQYDEEAAWSKAEPIFSTLELVLGDSMGANIEMPTAAELGFDITQEIFSNDVERELTRLETVLANPEGQPIAGELRAATEVLTGIGELLELPGFVEISKSAIAALNFHPDRFLAIGQATIDNFRTAQASILTDNRQCSPSAELLALAEPDEFKSDAPIYDSHEVLEDLEIVTDPNEAEFLTLVEPDELEATPDSDYSELESVFGQTDLDFNPPLDFDSEPIEEEFFENGQEFLETESSNEFDLSSETATTGSETETLTELDKKESAQPYVSESVRVDLKRLERLNNRVGELVTQENSALLQAQNLQNRLDHLQQHFNQFERLSKILLTGMERTQNNRESDASSPKSPKKRPQPQFLKDLDPLQLDAYSDFYPLVQSALEEVAQMGETLRDMTLLNQQVQQTQHQKKQTLKQVRNDLRWARMMPLSDILQRFPRMVRDLATQHDKRIQLIQTGVTTLVDKVMLERLYDPLIHLVRNAFDHGTELPQERIDRGKSPEATIEIRAYHRGNQTTIEVRDDGRGIDLEGIRKKALERGLLSESEAEDASRDRLYSLLFEPSFSTKSTASELSGRGMGLSTVQEQVKQLKGNISIASQPEQGTTFTIRLPLTLAIAQLLVFKIDESLMAIPINALDSIVAAPHEKIETFQGQPVYRDGERSIPLYPVKAFARHYPLPQNLAESSTAIQMPQQERTTLLVVADKEGAIALPVEQILLEQELAIKPFSTVVKPPTYLYGCTILGDGSLVPVLDGTALIEHWRQISNQLEPQIELAAPQSAATDATRPTILVVDDSLTTRQNLSLTLDRAGYPVIQASDGREALEKLRTSPQIAAVFCDIEMPKMNGFEFLNLCRKDYSASELPAIMLTSRAGEKHRGIAKLLGANNYLTKPYLERDLLEILQTCLRRD